MAKISVVAGLVAAAAWLPCVAGAEPAPDTAACALPAADARATIDADGLVGLMRGQPNGLCALPAASAYFAPTLLVRHYPPAPSEDGEIPGDQFARGVTGASAKLAAASGARFQVSIGKAAPDVVTETIRMTRPDAEGGPVEDISIASFALRDGRIATADFIHANPYAYTRLLASAPPDMLRRQKDDEAAADRLAAAMASSQGHSIEVVQHALADHVAVVIPGHEEADRLAARDDIALGMDRELGALTRVVTGFHMDETVTRDGTVVRVKTVMAGSLNGEPFSADSDMAYYVVGGAVVAFQAHHSPQGAAALQKALRAAGFLPG